MSVRDHLLGGEYILAQSPPLYVTTHRLIRYEEGPGGEEISHYPRERLESVEQERSPDHRIMILGTVVVLGGVYLLTLGFITSVLAIGVGVAGIFYGSTRGESYYQLHIHGVAQEEKARWQVGYRGSGRFIRTLHEILGEPPEV